MIGTYEATVFTESFIADSDEHVNQQSPDLLSKIIRKFEDLSGICTNNLLALPDEILHSICGHLDAKSLGKLRTSCSRLHRVCSDEGLWRKLYFKDFTTIGVDEGSWRKLYAVSFERSRLVYQNKKLKEKTSLKYCETESYAIAASNKSGAHFSRP